MSLKSKTKRTVSAILAVLMIAGMVAMALIPASADSINAAVKEDANGVLQIRTTAYASGTLSSGSLSYTFENEPVIASSGTAFLINPNTVLTCAHVINPEEMEAVISSYGLKYESVFYEVVINKDVTVTCSLENYSVQDDYAILTLNKAIGTKTVLKLSDSDNIAPTQKVYALGFPGVITEMQKVYDSENVTYDKDDVTITEGDIQKITSINNTKVIQHGCATSGGNSGGPIVNENGAVLGVHKWGDPEDNNSYHYATAINEVRKVLDTLLIDYELEDPSSAPAVTVTEVESETEQIEETKEPETIATISSTDATTDKSGSDNSSDNTKTFIVIAIIALVVILIAVVVIIIVISTKKKNNNGPKGGSGGPVIPPTTPQRPMPPTPPTPPYGRPPMPSGGAPTMPNNDGAGETSVLNDGAGETTVLGNQSTGFSLIRKANKEKIGINKPEFTIGKERRRVDYCIDNNNSVSRTHAKLKVRSGVCYIFDLGSTNCTYVNGTKLSPNQEIALKNGDKIKISDEEFEFIG